MDVQSAILRRAQQAGWDEEAERHSYDEVDGLAAWFGHLPSSERVSLMDIELHGTSELLQGNCDLHNSLSAFALVRFRERNRRGAGLAAAKMHQGIGSNPRVQAWSVPSRNSLLPLPTRFAGRTTTSIDLISPGLRSCSWYSACRDERLNSSEPQKRMRSGSDSLPEVVRYVLVKIAPVPKKQRPIWLGRRSGVGAGNKRRSMDMVNRPESKKGLVPVWVN